LITPCDGIQNILQKYSKYSSTQGNSAVNRGAAGADDVLTTGAGADDVLSADAGAGAVLTTGAVCVVPPGCAELTPGLSLGVSPAVATGDAGAPSATGAAGAAGAASAAGATAAASATGASDVQDPDVVGTSICFNKAAHTAVDAADAVVLMLGLSPLTQVI
jgi:hypothetical protein